MSPKSSPTAAQAASPAAVTDAAKLGAMANAIRALAIDAVEAAKSGHPGLPLGAADVATVLFTQFLKFDPTMPNWADRDRFVLSAGHGSMLLYALLHLTGYEDMRIEDIRNFRQLGSRAAGHPEFGAAAGIETTTGPLGQGIATAVGMAIAERHMAAIYGAEVVDHKTYVLASDGDLMEGISHEAISLAGHLKLSRLIVLFDDNGVSIDGPLSLADSSDQPARFKAAGWDTLSCDGHDMEAIARALQDAQDNQRPTLIACKTVIGYGAPTKKGTSAAHGAPLGEAEAAATKLALGWEAAPFEIPSEIRDAWRLAGLRGVKARKSWEKRLADLETGKRGVFEQRMRGDLPSGFSEAVTAYKKQLADEPKTVATRKASEMALEVLTVAVPEMVGGSADLTGSNNTRTKAMKAMAAGSFANRFIHYGVREHGMAAAMNGMALHGGIIPYSGTFLVFTDYCRPAMRLSALMHQRVIYVMTHDSIGLGEDGPTHQPVEHLASLRAIPNMLVFRPCDVVETIECWQAALENRAGPSVLALTRQNLPQLREGQSEKNMCISGGYVLRHASHDARVTLIATGSEVEIAVNAQAILEQEGISTSVVSMPCCELFDRQPKEYRDKVLSPASVRIVIEAASPMGWHRHVGESGAIIGMNGFGASGPIEKLYEHFGITADAAVTAAKRCLAAKEKDSQ